MMTRYVAEFCVHNISGRADVSRDDAAYLGDDCTRVSEFVEAKDSWDAYVRATALIKKWKERTTSIGEGTGRIHVIGIEPEVSAELSEGALDQVRSLVRNEVEKLFDAKFEVAKERSVDSVGVSSQ
jgi:hypothetical protein